MLGPLDLTRDRVLFKPRASPGQDIEWELRELAPTPPPAPRTLSSDDAEEGAEGGGDAAAAVAPAEAPPPPPCEPLSLASFREVH